MVGYQPLYRAVVVVYRREKLTLAFAPVFCATNRATRPYVCLPFIIGLRGLLLYCTVVVYVVCIDVCDSR